MSAYLDLNIFLNWEQIDVVNYFNWNYKEKLDMFASFSQTVSKVETFTAAVHTDMIMKTMTYTQKVLHNYEYCHLLVNVLAYNWLHNDQVMNEFQY